MLLEFLRTIINRFDPAYDFLFTLKDGFPHPFVFTIPDI